MRGSLLKNHSALLKKSKAASHASRAIGDRITDYEARGIITPAKASLFRKTLGDKNYSPLYIQKIHKDLDRLLTESSKASGNTTSSKSGTQHVSASSTRTVASSRSFKYSQSSSLKSQMSRLASSQSSISTAASNGESSSQAVSTSSTKSLASLSTQETDNSSLKTAISPTESQAASDTSFKTTSTVSQQWRSILMTSKSDRDTTKRPNKAKHIKWEDQSTSTGMSSTDSGSAKVAATDASVDPSTSTAGTKSTSQKVSTSLQPPSHVEDEKTGKRLILDLEEMKISSFNKPFSEEEIKRLFVEMCFYARLGFVQPPCCLRCAYQDGVKETQSPNECSRWVIWRKDSNLLWHPSHMEHNTAILQCHVATKLLAGESLEGFVWNAQEAVLEQVKNTSEQEQELQ